jgi:hypothetical protein
LPIQVAPLPLVEAQARAVVRAFREPAALDPTDEALAIVARLDKLRAPGTDERALVRAWHRLPDSAQFDYRDEMNAWADHKDVVVPRWAREIYGRKETLRQAWRKLESEGKAEEWVRGVGEGEGGMQEWVRLMYRLLEKRDEEERKGKL